VEETPNKKLPFSVWALTVHVNKRLKTKTDKMIFFIAQFFRDAYS